MKYICLGYIDPNFLTCSSESEVNAMMDSCFAYDDQLRANGDFQGGEALQPASTGVTLRYNNGRVVVTDGPFAETKEQLGGIMILEARDLNHAIDLISKHPGATFGPWEIRPAADLSDMMRQSEIRRGAAGKTFVTSREIPAAPEQVFAAISDPQRLARWWGPAGFKNTIHLFEFKNGGRWSLTMHGPNGANYPNESQFAEIDAPRRVVIRHTSTPHFQLTIALVPTATGTRVQWTQAFENADVAKQLAPIVVPANEENLERLSREVLAPAARS